MKESLKDFHILVGFADVQTEFFKQLPFAWHSNLGYFFTELIRLLPLGYFKSKSKVVRFSKETMLLAIASKLSE